MSELFSWPEGDLYVYTGSHTASGSPIAYVTNINVNASRAWQTDPAVDGTYHGHIVARRVDYSFQVGWLFGETLAILHAAETALHVKLQANMPTIGSAGLLVYSGYMPDLSWNGNEGGVFNHGVNGFGHAWSAF